MSQPRNGGGAQASQSPPAPGRFILPTQGLALRPHSRTIQSNAGNVGGRFLIMSEMSKHKERMKTVKPVISVSLPWSHAVGGGAFAHTHPAAAAATTASPTSTAHHQRPGSSMSNSSGVAKKLNDRLGRPSSAMSHSAPGAHPSGAAPWTPEELATALPSDEDKELYRAVIKLLSRFSPADAKGLTATMLKDVEERQLLEHYSGVYGASAQPKPAANSTASQPTAGNKGVPADEPTQGAAADKKSGMPPRPQSAASSRPTSAKPAADGDEKEDDFESDDDDA